MGIRFSASGSYGRTTNLPSATALTMAGWFKIVTDRNDYTAFFAAHTAIAAEIELQTNSDGTSLMLWVDPTSSAGSSVGNVALTVGTWYHLAVTNDGADVKAYVNGSLAITHTGDMTTALNQIWIASSNYNEWLNGEIGPIKIYGAVLSEEEIRQEMRQRALTRFSNLNAWYWMRSTDDDGVDYGPNGYNLSVSGTPANAEGPPIPWRRRRRSGFYVPAAAGGGAANLLRGKLHGGLLLGGKV